jgi:hypothetical protein
MSPVARVKNPCPRDASRGQALVETALVLPILALLLVMAIGLTLYIMRRRSRMGRRTPKF